MTSYQEAYEKMSLARASFLTANATITATLTGFTTYFPVIQTTLTQIHATKILQEADRKGDTMGKNAMRVTLTAQTMDVIRKVVALATNTGNNSLLELVNYKESDLKKCSDQKLVGICQVVRDAANANIAALATYGITAAQLATLQTSINSFNAAIPKGRVVTADSGESTQILTNLFKTLKANWAKINILVEMACISHPNFYDEDKKLRKVIVMGKGSLPLKVKVTNALTGAPEAKVTITVTPVNGQLKVAGANGKNSIVKKTAPGGGSNFSGLPDGSYIVTAEKPGMKTETLTVNVVNGESTVLIIKMVKE